MIRNLFALLVLALFCAACSGSGVVRSPGLAEAPVYRLAADDKVKVNVYGEAELTGQYLVGSDGNISFPLIGMVKAAGLTLAQLQQALTTQLAEKYLRRPQVSVDITEYRPFYILGEVNRAGQYPYRVGITVQAAVATAGGFTYRANHKQVAIKHANEANEQRYALTPDLQVLPGDTVRVLERYF